MASKKVYVALKTSKNPPVRVDPIILGKKLMKWRRDSDSISFKFKSITDLPPSFKVTKVSNKKINVKNNMDAGDFKYTITVEFNGTEYTTTESMGGAPAPGDKPVIRN